MKILKINEFIETEEESKSVHHHDYDATSSIRLNDLNDFPYLIFVNGGPHYGNGSKIYPHFIIQYKNMRIFINIPTVEDWNKNKNLKYNNKYEEIVSSFKDKLIEWLDNPQNIYPEYSNLIGMRLLWNHLS